MSCNSVLFQQHTSWSQEQEVATSSTGEVWCGIKRSWPVSLKEPTWLLLTVMWSPTSLEKSLRKTLTAPSGRPTLVPVLLDSTTGVNTWRIRPSTVSDSEKKILIRLSASTTSLNNYFPGQTLDEAGFQVWGKGQPDNSTRARTGDTGEFCGVVFRDGLLNDLWCNVPVPFLCEKNRDSLLVV